MTSLGRFHAAILVVALSVFCILTIAYGRTLSPTNDEGVFSDPAVSLATEGRLSSSMMDEIGRDFQGVTRHIYYMPPLHFVLLAGWYKVWGVSLWATRLLSAAFGLGLISAWLMVFRPIYGRSCVYFPLALALDGNFIIPSARGRMDMECACLGLAAIALYLTFRERRFVLAMLGATSLIVASGLAHPNGIFYLVDLLLITVWLDRQRWSWKVGGIALLPFVIGGVAWGAYILQDPADFVRQFTANAHTMNRLSGIRSPLESVYREVSIRYASTFGFQSLRDHPLQTIKGIALFAYLVSIVSWIASRRFRKAAPIGPFLMVAGVNALMLALGDGQKRPYYMIHIIPPLDAAVVAWALWAMADTHKKVTVALLLSGCAFVQIGLHISRIRRDAYHREYMSAVGSLRQHLDSRTKLVFAPPEYGFELGFGPIIQNDSTFGYYSGKVADVIVTDQFHDGDLSEIRDAATPIVRHIEDVLKKRYDLSYNESWAQIFLPRNVRDRSRP